MDTEMEFSDGEQTNAKAQVALSQYSTPLPPPPVYNRANLLSALGNSSVGLEPRIEMRHDHEQQLPGYIFMCNARTKVDCYRYRVFGIPSWRKEVVESIKPGMKLFLYDFEKKLLYGVYEATIGGRLDIEPEAFDRKYPAQVGFRIFKNCYPLPENTFKSAIYENYKGSKFKQELAPHQVMSLLSLFRSFVSPELDSLPQRLASRPSASRTLSFEERFIAATQLRNASSVLDPLSARHAAYQSVPKASLLQHSYPRQNNYSTPQNEALSPSNLNQLYYPTESRQQRVPEDPPRSSIQDPQLKYLTILSNIRRYGSAPEKSASENEYYPATPSEKDQFTSPYSDNKYYSSTLTGNEHPSASAANGSVYGSEFYTSASQKEREASQQHAIPSGTYYHSEASTVSNTAVSMQPDTQTANVAQSRTETVGYQTRAHSEAIGVAAQRAAEAIGYTHQPTSSAANYSTLSQPGTVEESTQSYARTVDYTQQQYYTAMGHTAQHYGSETGYVQQPHEIVYQLPDATAAGYTQQPHAASTGYVQQYHAAATIYAQPPHAASTGYAQQTHDASTGYVQQPNAAAAYYAQAAQQPHAAATVYAQQPHAAATGYAVQSHPQAVGYTAQYDAQAVGYTPQYHAQVAGYAQQTVAQGSVPGPPGTTDWKAASQAYAAAGDWNAVNQAYYPYTADATTTFNQTS